MFAVVITGPPGAGKTTVLTALQNVLADDGIKHAVIEVEALAWAWAYPLTDEQSFRHLASGVTVAPQTSDGHLSALLRALAPTERLVVRLDANAATLRQRIVDREPPEWSGLPQLVEATEGIARASRLLEDVDMTCSTEGPRRLISRIGFETRLWFFVHRRPQHSSTIPAHLPARGACWCSTPLLAAALFDPIRVGS